MRIGVLSVPFITCEAHFSSLQNTIQSVSYSQGSFELLTHAVVNRCDNPEYLEKIHTYFNSVELNDKNILARAWNKGIRNLLDKGCSYVLVINLDVVLHPFLIEKLAASAELTTDAVMWSAYEAKDTESLLEHTEDEIKEDYTNFSCYMVNKRLFEVVGEFDEQFEPAYHEDSDMLYRMQLANARKVGLASAKFLHTGQGTLKAIIAAKDEALALKIRLGMNRSMELYEAKWGGLPAREVYNVPYNKK